jgi:diguanylate cyclase (GGDEF)-like protein
MWTLNFITLVLARHRHSRYVWVAWLCLGVGLAQAWAQPQAMDSSVLELHETGAPQILTKALRVWVDDKGTAAVNEVDALPDAAFKPLPRRQDAPQGPHQALWVRLDLRAQTTPNAWMLSTPQVSIDHVDLYYRDAKEETWKVQRAGTSVPVAQWPISERRPTFAVQLKNGGIQRFYIRAHDMYGSWTGLQAMTVKTHAELGQREMLLWGLYVGVAIVVLCLGIANWFSSRETVWLSYAAYNSLMTLAQLSLIGLAGTLFFNQLPWLNEFGVFTFLCIASVAFLLFSVQASQALRYARTLAWVAIVYVALSALMVLVFAIMPTSLYPLHTAPLYVDAITQRADFFSVVIILLTFGCGLLISMMFFVTWRRGHGFSGMALVVILCTVLSSVPQILYSLNLIPRSWLTEHGLLFGLMFESVAMLYVMQRHSRSLAHIKGQLRHLKLHDALTGLIPRASAIERLDRLLERMHQSQKSCDVLYLHVDNIDDIARQYGHEVSDAALLLTARHLTELRSGGDLVTRLDHSSFMLALGDKTAGERNAETLRAMATTLIAKGLSENPLLDVVVKVEIRVWIARIQGEHTAAAKLVENLEKRAKDTPPSPSGKRIYLLTQHREHDPEA